MHQRNYLCFFSLFFATCLISSDAIEMVNITVLLNKPNCYTKLLEYAEQHSNVNLSEEGQYFVLSSFMHNYKDSKNATQILTILKKFGISLDYNDKITKYPLLFSVVHDAFEFGNMNILEAFLLCGANPHVIPLGEIKKSPYEVAYWNIGKRMNALKIFSTFIRCTDDFTFPKEKIYDCSQKLNDLFLQTDREGQEKALMYYFDTDRDVQTKLDTLLFAKPFFYKKTLSPATQESILNSIINEHSSSEWARVFFALALKYGLELNKARSDARTGFEYIVDYALSSGNTIVFEEAIGQGFESYKGIHLSVFLDLNSSVNAAKLKELLK